MANKKDRIDNLAAIFLILIGIFLIIDSLFIHATTYDYSKLGIQAIDPFISHWMWGAVCVVLGVWSLKEK